MNDVAAERAVLAGVFQYGSEAYGDIADLVTTNTFTTTSSQAIWKCLDHLLKDNNDVKPDYPSVLSAAQTIGLKDFFSKPSEWEYLRAVSNFPVRLENTRKLAGKVRKLEISRLMHAQLGASQQDLEKVTGDESIAHILGLVENPIFDLTSLLNNSSQDGPQRIGGGVRAYIDYLSKNQRDTVGISSGYPLYDMAIGGGFRPGTVNVVGGRPKSAKSQFADNVAGHVSGTLGLPSLYLDTELMKEDHWNRMLAKFSGIPVDDIERGKWKNNSAINNAIGKLEKMPYDYLSIAGQPFEETVAIMRRWVTKTVGLQDNGAAKPCLIIFDYIKLMSSDSMSAKSLAEFQVLGFMMTSLHNFMVRWKVPCLAFIQLNRDGITREDTDVASGSDRIIWLCSNFSIFKKKSDEEMAEQTGQKNIFNRKLVPIVARHGAGLDDGDYINYNFEGKFARITEGPTRNGLMKNQNSNKGSMTPDDEPTTEQPF